LAWEGGVVPMEWKKRDGWISWVVSFLGS
jgi:hypothetical protein